MCAARFPLYLRHWLWSGRKTDRNDACPYILAAHMFHTLGKAEMGMASE